MSEAIERGRRLFVCRGCSRWVRGRCTLGAGPESPTGCPERHFDAPARAALPAPPRAAQRLAGMLGEAGRWVAAGAPLTAKETAQARLTICRACPLYRDGFCGRCGCFMPLKAQLATVSCPDNPPRW